MRYAILVLFALAAFAGGAGSLMGQEQQSTLNATYDVSVGDIVALIIPEFLKLNENLYDPILVTFEPEPEVIDFEIFGTRADVEGARQVMDQLQLFISSTVSPYLERRFEVTLPPSRYRIMYYNRNERERTAALVLVFDDGQYVMP